MTPAELAASVVQWGPLSGVSPSDPALLRVCEAVVAHVATLPVVAEAGADVPASATHGALMLAARLYRRRNSPNGLEAFSADGAVYVSRYDSDVAMLLRLSAPQVG